jgi:serine/threonine protein kinase
MEDALKKRGVFGTADYVSPEVRTFATVDSHAMDNTRRVFGNASYASPESAPAAKLHGLPEQRARATGAGHGGACRHEAVGVTCAGRASGLAGTCRATSNMATDCRSVSDSLTLSAQVLSGREVSCGVDWWALGVILFEFLTGRPPFHASKRSETFSNILNRRLKFPKQVGASVRIADSSKLAKRASRASRIWREGGGGGGGGACSPGPLRTSGRATGMGQCDSRAHACHARATRVSRTPAHGWLRFQAEVPARFKDIIDQLLTVNPKFRLGSPTRNGAQSVMQAPPQPEPQRTHFHAHASSRDTRTLAHTHSLLHAFTHTRTHARTHMRTS